MPSAQSETQLPVVVTSADDRSLLFLHDNDYNLSTTKSTSVTYSDFGNCSQNLDYDQHPLLVQSDPYAVAWLAFATVTSVAGNAIIVWIVLATSSLRAIPHNRLVVQLAVCDLLTAAINAPPIAATMLIGQWTLGDVVCQLNGTSTTLLGIASVITLSVISLNRSAASIIRH